MQKTPYIIVLLASLIHWSGANVALASDVPARNQDKSGLAGVVNIAFSEDGVHFNHRPEPFLVGGDAPTLTELPNGDLLAVVDYYSDNSANAKPVMSVTRSRDGGQSWSRLQPVMLFMPKIVPLQGQRGALVTLADGRVVLYFVQHMEPSESAQRKKRSTAVLRAAISKNGLRYRLLNDVNISISESSYITGWRHHGAVHLALESLSTSTRKKRSSRRSRDYLISRDGEHFARMRPTKIQGARFVGSVVPTADGLLGFFTSKNNVRAFSSKSGRKWRPSDIELAKPSLNPAVAKLSDGRFVMLSMSTTGRKNTCASRAQNHLVDSSYVDSYQQTRTESKAGNSTSADSAKTDKPNNAQDPALVMLDNQEEVDEEYADTAARLAPVFEDIGFAPLPNWEEKIDYLAWYNDVLLDQTSDNAYDEYAKFLPGDSEPDTDWFYAPSMFNTTEKVAIGPWDPKLELDWEKGNREAQDILSQFRAVTELEGYAAPLNAGKEMLPGDPASANLLLGMLLPNLSHHRQLTKMSLADAWRKKNGSVSASKMIEAFQVGLRHARHMQMGATLIEELVSGAQRALIYKNALAALKYDVFDSSELKSARDTLRIHDPGGKDPMYSIRGEHAFAMDMTQYLFEPDGPDGKLEAVPERAKMASDYASEGNEDHVIGISAMTETDVYETLDMFDNYYRELGELMRIGYPSVRAEDIEAVTENVLHTSPLSEVFLPSLSRYYELNTRIETSRRATQLAYEVHVYRSKNGHWPNTLDNIPSDLIADIRIDPFSGVDFGYRLTSQGPTIYSFSDNGVDDGGVHSKRWGDEITNDAGSDDYVFWPVQP